MRYTALEVENFRRSAAMAPLPQTTVIELLADHKELLAERERILALVTRLQAAFTDCRDPLNTIAHLIDGRPNSS